MIWWFLISINFLFFLIKSFFTPKDTNYMNDIHNNQTSTSTEKYILGENYNLTSLKLKIDFGSLDTGTKIIEYSKGIINIRSIQQYDYDSYMLTPCNSDIWWIYSFSDIIHIEKIGLVSLEHYASNFKVIEILGSDVYPTKKWKKLGKIATNFTKSFELFNIYEYCKNYEEDNCWVKYMKVVVLSHHNLENNYYCTLTHLQIFASSGVDMLSDKIYSDDNTTQVEKKFHDNYVHEKKEQIGDHQVIENLEVLFEDNERKQAVYPAAATSDGGEEKKHRENKNKENKPDSLEPDSAETHTSEHNSTKPHPKGHHFTPFENAFLDAETIEEELIDTELMDSKLMDTELIKKELMDTELIEKELMNTELTEKYSKTNHFNEHVLDRLTEQIGNVFEDKNRENERNIIKDKADVDVDASSSSSAAAADDDEINKSQQRDEEKNKTDASSTVSTKQNMLNQKYHNKQGTSNAVVILNKAMKNKYVILQNFNKLKISKLLKYYPFITYKNVIKKYIPYIEYFMRDRNTITYHNYNSDDVLKTDHLLYSAKDSLFGSKKRGNYMTTRSSILSPVHLLLKKVFVNSYRGIMHMQTQEYNIPNGLFRNYNDKKTFPDSSSAIRYRRKPPKYHCYNYDSIKNLQDNLLKNKHMHPFLNTCKYRSWCKHDMICLYKQAREINKVITFRNNLIKSTIRKYLVFMSSKTHPSRRSRYNKLKEIKIKIHPKKWNIFRNIFLLTKFSKMKYNKKFHYMYSSVFRSPLCDTSGYFTHKDLDTLSSYILEKFNEPYKLKDLQNLPFDKHSHDGYTIMYLFHELKKRHIIYDLEFVKYCFDYVMNWKNTFYLPHQIYLMKNKTLLSLHNHNKCYDILQNLHILKKKKKLSLENELHYYVFFKFYKSRTCKRVDRFSKRDLSYYLYTDEEDTDKGVIYGSREFKQNEKQFWEDEYMSDAVTQPKDQLNYASTKNKQISVESLLLKYDPPSVINIFTMYAHMLRGSKNLSSRHCIFFIIYSPNHRKLLTKLIENIFNILLIQKNENEIANMNINYIRNVISEQLTNNFLFFKKFTTSKSKLLHTKSAHIRISVFMDLFHRVKNQGKLLHSKKVVGKNIQENEETYFQSINKTCYGSVTAFFMGLITNRISIWRDIYLKKKNDITRNENKLKVGGKIQHPEADQHNQIRHRYREANQSAQLERNAQPNRVSKDDVCLTLGEMESIIYSDEYLKKYVDEANMHKETQKKKKIKNLVNVEHREQPNDKSIKILNEIKETEENNNKLINEVYDIINEYHDNDESKTYSVVLKSGKQIPLIIKKPGNKIKEKIINDEGKKKNNKENKLQYLEEFDHVLNDHIHYNNYEQNCIREEKIEERSKNTRGHALLTLVDKVKTIENKNNYVISKLKDVIKITNNKTKIIYYLLSNLKILQNTINLLLKYIMINEKNMKNLNKNRNKTESLFKIMKEICILTINEKNQQLDSLQFICKYLQDILYDEIEKIYLFEKSTGGGRRRRRRATTPNSSSNSSSMGEKFPLCGEEEENMLLHNKNSFHDKNAKFLFKEKKRTIFNFLYYENHCHNDIFKTPIIYYKSSVDKIQTFYNKVYNFFTSLSFLNYILYKIKYLKKIFINYLNWSHIRDTSTQYDGSLFGGTYNTPQNSGNLWAVLLVLLFIIFLINNFFCFLMYKHLSNKLNRYIQGCSCVT
ncbi:hypothetical protein, conserved [Plasmodium gonderi]|uniref:SUN domain-containing protein n=1 Tax=Plasmodium gonderi TaxID=77519 RepID=A0A1Y1JQG8_PLAGO|nr:hypothetical protein, conserved [Plasmodium gonderi]GAW82693.1 hypothetical protein, conserved [Plasmodium gonderi]